MSSFFNQNTPFGNYNRITQTSEVDADRITARSIDADKITVGGADISGEVEISGDLDMGNNNIINVNQLKANTVSATTYDYVTSQEHTIVDDKIIISSGGANETELSTSADGVGFNRDVVIPAGTKIHFPDGADFANVQQIGAQLFINTQDRIVFSLVGGGGATAGAFEVDGGGNLSLYVDGNIYHNGASQTSGLSLQEKLDTKVEEADIRTLTNKTIDADLNSISNIEDTEIKAGANINVTKLGTGAVDNTEFSYLNGVTSGIQGQIDGKISASSADTLTNKTINADNNTITNIDNGEIKALAGIDATKIADGSVSNTEFQYINSVTSNVQTQLNAKANEGSHTDHPIISLTSPAVPLISTTVGEYILFRLKTSGTADDVMVLCHSDCAQGKGVEVNGQLRLNGGDIQTQIDAKAEVINDLTDVNITSLADGEILKYDNGTGKWINAPDGGAGAINDLTDVNITSLADGEILKYDSGSGKWINVTDTDSGVVDGLTIGDGSASLRSITYTNTTNGDLTLNHLSGGTFEINKDANIPDIILNGTDSVKNFLYDVGVAPAGTTFNLDGTDGWIDNPPQDVSGTYAVGVCECEIAQKVSPVPTASGANTCSATIRPNPNDPNSAITNTTGKSIYFEVTDGFTLAGSRYDINIVMNDNIFNGSTNTSYWYCDYRPYDLPPNSKIAIISNDFGGQETPRTINATLSATAPGPGEKLGIWLDFPNDQLKLVNGETGQIIYTQNHGAQADWIALKSGTKTMRFAVRVNASAGQVFKPLALADAGTFYSTIGGTKEYYLPSYGSGGGGELLTSRIYSKTETDGLLGGKADTAHSDHPFVKVTNTNALLTTGTSDYLTVRIKEDTAPEDVLSIKHSTDPAGQGIDVLNEVRTPAVKLNGTDLQTTLDSKASATHVGHDRVEITGATGFLQTSTATALTCDILCCAPSSEHVLVVRHSTDAGGQGIDVLGEVRTPALKLGGSDLQTTLDTKITASSADTLTNKTINADNNTITNIDNGEIKALAGIDATKIADGSVTNAEFQHINTVTSNVQNQLDSKLTVSGGYGNLSGTTSLTFEVGHSQTSGTLLHPSDLRVETTSVGTGTLTLQGQGGSIRTQADNFQFQGPLDPAESVVETLFNNLVLKSHRLNGEVRVESDGNIIIENGGSGYFVNCSNPWVDENLQSRIITEKIINFTEQWYVQTGVAGSFWNIGFGTTHYDNGFYPADFRIYVKTTNFLENIQVEKARVTDLGTGPADTKGASAFLAYWDDGSSVYRDITDIGQFQYYHKPNCVYLELGSDNDWDGKEIHIWVKYTRSF